MFEIDGSRKSGSGTILRLSVALSAIAGKPLHLYNIREKRPKPGLKPQHLEAVLTAARLCGAKVEGATLYSKEIWFGPKEVKGGNFTAKIGTAGSIPMLLSTVIPICAFAKEPVYLIVKGGTDVAYSPTINYLRYVFLTWLRRIGIDISITIQRFGYYPKGNGEVTLSVKPSPVLRPIRMENFGQIEKIKGISTATFLARNKVAERQAKSAKEYLSRKGYPANIQIVNDRSNSLQRGSSIVLWAETDQGVVLGADAIGQLKKASEVVGREAAEKLYAEILTTPTVDVHSANMLIPYLALAKGKATYLTRTFSDHLETNIWLAEKMLNVHFKVEKVNRLYKIEKND